MSIGQELGGFPNEQMSHKELVDHVANLQKTVEYYLGGKLGSDNAMEFGGWFIKSSSLTSKTGNVGLSSAGSGTNAVRFWAGGLMDSAPYRVYDDGRFVATSADITGSINMTSGNITWGSVTAPDYTQIAGTKPPADANNTYNELLYNSGIRGFVNQGGTLFISADYIRSGTITSVKYNAFNPNTPNKRIQIDPLVTSDPAITFWNELSTTAASGQMYLTTGNFQNDGTGTHTYFSLYGPDRMQISSDYVWFNAGTVDFGISTIKGANFTAKFG